MPLTCRISLLSPTVAIQLGSSQDHRPCQGRIIELTDRDEWCDFEQKTHLCHEDIADSCHDPLVEQRRSQGSVRLHPHPSHRLRLIDLTPSSTEQVRSQVADEPMLLVGRHQIQIM